jgi:hypothetical protein
MRRKRYFRTKDLVTIAVLSCLGAVMSTYVGYLGRMLGTVTGVPLASQGLTGAGGHHRHLDGGRASASTRSGPSSPGAATARPTRHSSSPRPAPWRWCWSRWPADFC